METKDRLKLLNNVANTTLNGIDFVEIASPDQTTLRVHFLNTVAVAGTLTSTPTITGGDTIRTVASIRSSAGNWSSGSGRAGRC